MHKIRRPSIIELTASHLRKGILNARWPGALPGVRRLAAEMDVSHDTVRAALRQLESDGLLCKPSSPGRSRQTNSKRSKSSRLSTRKLRVALLCPQQLGSDTAHPQQLILSLLTSIEHLGHQCFIAPQSLAQLGGDPRRLARLVRDSEADAWVVYSASRATLEWFTKKQIPVMAIGGPTQSLPVACTRSDNIRAMQQVLDLLVSLHHRRIVFVCPRSWREKDLHPSTRFFLERMAHHGIKTSAYHLPDWEETPEGVPQLMGSLFKATPPTALLFFNPCVAVSSFLFLSQKGLCVPRDVSLLSMTPDPVFSQLQPAISHFNWEIAPHVRRITRWVDDLARGRADKETKTIHATFVPGETIGPARLLDSSRLKAFHQ